MSISPPLVLRALCCAACLAAAVPAYAQSSDESHWSIAAGWLPQWESGGTVKVVNDLFFNAESGVSLQGSEFRIGVGRGRTFGGDWSISFVRKRLDPSSTALVYESVDDFFNPPVTFSERIIAQDVRLDGVEFAKFVPFGTIRRRAQIGMNFGVGVAKAKGTVLIRRQTAEFIQTGTTVVAVPRTEEVTAPADEMLAEFLRESMNSYLPLAKLELAVAAIVIPSVKVRFSGGVNLPGYPAFGITVVHLFGAR